LAVRGIMIFAIRSQIFPELRALLLSVIFLFLQ
jgi:hypothetical protein